jgi:hypothetical protein
VCAEQRFLTSDDGAIATDAEQLVGEESSAQTQAVTLKSFAGMRSKSALGPGGVEVTLQGPIDLGRRSDFRVATHVIDQLRADGRNVEVLTHTDKYGEDAQVRCDGEFVTIQVVSLRPTESFVAEASRGSATTLVPVAQAASWVNDAVRAKATQYGPDVRAEMLLAVDTRAVAVVALPQIVDAVHLQFGDLRSANGFGAVWLVGPLPSYTTRFPGSRW